MIAQRMTGASLLAAAALLSAPLVGHGDARAQACDIAHYNHNGSLMTIHACDDGRMTIEYDRPKAGLAKQGVRPGTIVMKGRFWDSGGPFRRVRGTAYLFKGGCPPAPYDVDGYWMDTGHLEMSGTAPVRKSGCRATGTRMDNLLFQPR